MRIGDRVIYIQDHTIGRGTIVSTFDNNKRCTVDPDTMEYDFPMFQSDLMLVEDFESNFIYREELRGAMGVLNALVGMDEED